MTTSRGERHEDRCPLFVHIAQADPCVVVVPCSHNMSRMSYSPLATAVEMGRGGGHPLSPTL